MGFLAPVQKRSVRFSARSFVAFALTPEAPIADWLDRLDGWTQNSPGFFAGRPVVLDLALLQAGQGEVAALVAELAGRGIRVYAIEAAGLEELGPGLPPLLKNAKAAAFDERQPASGKGQPDRSSDALESNSLMIRNPIRSGQSIFHPHGDVIVLGSVGSGSEIVAGGSVHVYGALRGRVFAGATGNPQARIFCRRNEAELLAVDGWYRTADDMEPASRGVAVQAWLADGVICIEALN